MLYTGGHERLNNFYILRNRNCGVVLLLLTFFIAYLADGDMSLGVITVPMSLILIFGKGRWIR